MYKLLFFTSLLICLNGSSQERILKSELIEIKQSGQFILYYKKNKLSKKRPFNGIAYTQKEEKTYVEGVANGLAKEFNDDGLTILEGDYKNGQKSGVWKKWDNNGDLVFEGNYKNGNASGFWRYFEGGRLHSEGNIKNLEGLNKEDGLWKYYDTKGRLWSERNYENGEENGLRREWHPNGELKYRGTHIGSMQNEICRWFYLNGTLKLEQIFDMGLKAGTWKGFYDNGILKWEKVYKANSLVYEKCFDQAGTEIDCIK